jgi:hypothetical protein
MATLSLDDPRFQPLTPEEEERRKKQKKITEDNKQDIVSAGIDETDIELAVEQNNEVSGLTSFAAGVASGAIKIPEGVVSITAELFDLGGGRLFGISTPDAEGMTEALGKQFSYAAEVEKFFDKLNPFEELADERAAGKISEALTQLVGFGTAGAKLTLKGVEGAAKMLAKKAVKAKKSGRLVSPKNPNLKKGLDKADQLNKLTGAKRFGVMSLGGAAGEVFVVDNEKIGTFGDLFEGGPTELDRDVEPDVAEDASRKLLNRLKFGTESILLAPFVYGIGQSAKFLAKRGKEAAYSSSKLARGLDKLASIFRFRGTKPQEIAAAKQQQKARSMRDTNFAEEKVALIDKEIDKVFPEYRKFFNASSNEERKQFLKLLDDTLFEGDLTKPLDKKFKKDVLSTVIKRMGKDEGVITGNKILSILDKTRKEFNDLLEITAAGPGAKVDLPVGVTKDLRKIMGNRVKNYIGNTFEIFEDAEAGFFQKYKPTKDAIDRTKQLFMRYAAKNKNPITELEAEGMVNDIIKQVRKMDPSKDTLPTFMYQNLSKSADDAMGLKTFAQTLEKNLPGGKKEIQVIGKGSKIFRELFGEINDVRHSIFEGTNRLSAIARKNQLFDEILEVDEAMKAAAKSDTPLGQRGFFHDSPLSAKRAFGPEAEIVKMDDYVKEYFKEGVLVNRLSNTYTTREIAEGFTNVSKIQDFMRGDTGGALGKTFSAAWRYGILTPKAGAQYAKTILSVPTHIRNFLSSAAFSIANGAILSDPRVFARAMKNAFGSVQVGGPRKELSQEKYREYLELGIVNTNVRLGDLRNLMKDIRFGEGNIATDSVLKPMLETLGKRTSRGVKKVGKFMQDLYVAEDDIWKIINYETQLVKRGDLYKKANIKISDDALKKEVAEIVQDTVPNYAKVGEFVRAMRVSPLGNFMSWPSEVFRTGAGIFRQIIKDLKDPITGKINPITSTNPMKAEGMKRLVGMSFAMGVIPYGLIKGSQAIYGVTQEEADAARDFVAPWSKNSQLIFVKDPDTGELYYTDWSKNNVYDTLTRPFQSLLTNVQQGIEDEEVLLKGFIEGIGKAMGETASPFISESIYSEAFADIMLRGGRTREGQELWTERTPLPEQIIIGMQHVIKTLKPTTAPFERTYKGIKKIPGKGPTMYEVPKELAGIFGFRLEKVDPEKALGFYLYDLRQGQSEATKLFTGGKFGVLSGEPKTPKDVVERYFVANKALFDVRKEAQRHLLNAMKLGVNPNKLEEIFEKRGISTKLLDSLLSGEFKPFFPSEKIQERFEDIAFEGGQPNPFLGAEGILEAMKNLMEIQNLYGDFNLELSDFIPDTDPKGQSALPPTEMPNPDVIQTSQMPSNMNQGLTQVENALLSDEEKQIRLRQRGLA